MCWRKYSGLLPIGEVPPNVLAKVQWTFANWRSSTECVGESKVDVRQLAKVRWGISVITQQYYER
ncbi:unnamed protein product, partial [Rotaria socialis]